MTTNAKICLACHRAIKGRIDKKFCDDNCRNNYNNRLNSDATPLIRNINNILRKNRRILEQLLAAHSARDTKRSSGTTAITITVSRENIARRGFHFSYSTHSYTNAKDEVYYYCYDYGYKQVDENRVQIVKAIPELAEREWDM